MDTAAGLPATAGERHALAVDRQRREDRRRLAVVFSVTLVGILGNTVIGPVLPDITDDLGVGAWAVGLPVAATALPGVAMAPVIGVLADRWGRRPVLVVCLLVFAAFGVAGASAPSFWVLLVLRVGMGLGAAGLINLAVVLIGDRWDGHDRARRIGWNAAVLTAGIAVFPVIGGFLGDAGSWRLPFVTYAVGFVAAALAWRWLEPQPPRTDVTVRRQVGQAAEALRSPELVTVLGAALLMFTAIFALTVAALPELLDEVYDLRAGQRGLVLLALAVTSTIASLGLARLHRWRGRRTTVISGAVLFAVASFGVAGADALVVVVIAVALSGLAEGMVIPTLQDLAVGSATDDNRGSVMAVFVSGTRTGQTIGPLVAAAALAASSPEGAYFAGAMLSLAVVVWVVVRRRHLAAA